MSEVHKIFDRRLVCRHRQRAAARDAPPDFLLQRFIEDIVERLGLIKRTFARVLVIGAQGGRLSAALASRPGVEFIVDMDASPVLIGSGRHPGVAADEEALPFAPEAFDLVVAGLTLQWVNDLPGALLQIRQTLKPDGLFLGGLFGGATLSELREAWLHAESERTGGVSPRVAPVADVRDLGGLLQRAGFALPVVDSDVIKVRYATPIAVMADIKAMGAANALLERSRRPVTRSLLMGAAQEYVDRFGDPGGKVGATYEMLVMTAWAPGPDQPKPLRPGSATVRLAEALGVDEHRLAGPAGAAGPDRGGGNSDSSER